MVIEHRWRYLVPVPIPPGGDVGREPQAQVAVPRVEEQQGRELVLGPRSPALWRIEAAIEHVPREARLVPVDPPVKFDREQLAGVVREEMVQ